MKKFLERYYDRFTFLLTFFAVIIIHGEMIFNKISLGDDTTLMMEGLFSYIGNGRWFAEFIKFLAIKFKGLESVPTFFGAFLALTLAAIACILVSQFKIKDKFQKIALCLIIATSLYISGLLGFMSTTAINSIGIFFAAAATLAISYKSSAKNFIIASVILCFAMGEYQCYLTFYLTAVLLLLIKEIILEGYDLKTFILRGVYFVVSAIAGLLEYLVVLKLTLKCMNVSLNSDYAAIDTYGFVSIKAYFERAAFAYYEFFFPDNMVRYTQYPFHSGIWHALVMVLLLVAAALVVASFIIKKEYVKIFEYLLCTCLIPLALNFNFVLYAPENVHALHTFQYVYLYVFILISAKYGVESLKAVEKELISKVKQYILPVVCTCICLISFAYARYENVCYLQHEVWHSEAVSYLTRLVSRIESLEGYSSDMPVCIIGNKYSVIDEDYRIYDAVVTNPYYYNPINAGVTADYLKIWCAFDPEYLNPSDYEGNSQVQAMTYYPSDGSIRIIDGVVVVKCSDDF